MEERDVEKGSVKRTEVSSEPEKNYEALMRERKEKMVYFFKNSQLWVLVILIIALILGVYIRSMPMHDHGGRPGLWDITTNTWTLGPDLDPWLFYRNAKTIVETGSLPEIDMMRNVPLGFNNLKESQLLSYMIAWTYYGLNLIGMNISIEFAAVIFPVIMFALTIIAFFLFVREIFVRKSKKSKLRANIIALISTFFMIVIPIFLSRTVAGIPEKESAAFFFMFLAFYLFLKGWKSKNLKIAFLLSIFSGIVTGLMGLIWGGVLYVFIPIGGSCLIAFLLNKIHKREFIIYGLWIFFSFASMIPFSSRYSLIGMLESISSGLAALTLFIIIIHFLIWNTKISNMRLLRDSKYPKTVISLFIGIVLLLIFASIFFGPSFIIEKVKAIHQTIFKPVTGRWNITVAENRQPNFKEWSSNFGPFIRDIPIMFWLFFAGSVVLFRKMMNCLKKKDAWILTVLYVFFFFGVVFSRYSGDSILNGENFVSKLFYYGSVLLLAGFVVYYYVKYYKTGDKSFEKIKLGYLLLFFLFTLSLLTARGAVRLIMVLGPIAPIFAGFLIIESIDKFRKIKDSTLKVIFGAVVILILILSLYSFWVFYNGVKAQSYSFVPSAYNMQWQKAMEWVRESTPENAVFGHWWDYGYWLQSIGNRATVLDGGNAIGYWNYLMGRWVLTGDNQDDALEFLYNHNTTHFLIDSTDIGKYTAFSSIGSDLEYDRYSWFGTFLLDEKNTQETNNQTLNFYLGGSALDEDLIIEENGREILLPRQGAGVGAIVLPSINGRGYGQPYVLMVYQGKRYKVNLRYLHVNGEFFDFKEGIEACAYVFPKIEQQGQGIKHNPTGAAMFISPRLFRGLLSQIYILEDPLERFPNFKLVHNEPSLFVENLRSQGLDLLDFVYFNGIQGPIKIWEIQYTGEEQIKDEYSDTDYSKYIDWKL